MDIRNILNAHRSPVKFLTCSPLTYQLSPRSGASGYQNRVHKNHEYLIICPVCPQLHAFLSDRLSTWGKAAAGVWPAGDWAFGLWSVSEVYVLYAVAGQGARAAELAGVIVEALATHDGDVEVDQVVVLGRAAADAVCGVAGAAR